MPGLVRGEDVGSGDIGIGIHGDRADTEFLARTDHPYGDLASVRNQQRSDGSAHAFPELWLTVSRK